MFGFIVIYILTMHISTVPCMKTSYLPFINKLIYTKAHSNDILTALNASRGFFFKNLKSVKRNIIYVFLRHFE